MYTGAGSLWNLYMTLLVEVDDLLQRKRLAARNLGVTLVVVVVLVVVVFNICFLGFFMALELDLRIL